MISQEKESIACLSKLDKSHKHKSHKQVTQTFFVFLGVARRLELSPCNTNRSSSLRIAYLPFYAMGAVFSPCMRMTPRPGSIKRLWRPRNIDEELARRA